MEIGKVTHYFDRAGAVAIKLSKELKIGDKIKIIGGGEEFELEVKEMQINRKPITKAKKGDEIGVLINHEVKKGYKVEKM